MGQPKGEMVVLKEFFGLQPGQTTGEFIKEVNALGKEDKRELAVAVAGHLEVELKPAS